MDDAKFESLTERQRFCLRLVYERCSSGEIAYREGSSARAVDKQLTLACKKLGVTSRVTAANMLHEYEAGVERFDPRGRTNMSSQPGHWRLPWPLPSKTMPANMLSRQQVLAWAAIISIATPAGLTVAAMAVVAIAILLGVHL